MKNDFSITFWIRVDKNPAWKQIGSEINFPPFTVNDGIQVFFCKIEKYLKVYVLHPELGYRKIVANIEEYFQKDVFVVLTNDNDETKLYLNAELKTTVKKKDVIKNLEIGDYVMVEPKNGDLKNFKFDKEIKIVLPAKVKKFDKKTVELYFFDQNETAILDRENLKT